MTLVCVAVRQSTPLVVWSEVLSVGFLDAHEAAASRLTASVRNEKRKCTLLGCSRWLLPMSFVRFDLLFTFVRFVRVAHIYLRYPSTWVFQSPYFYMIDCDAQREKCKVMHVYSPKLHGFVEKLSEFHNDKKKMILANFSSLFMHHPNTIRVLSCLVAPACGYLFNVNRVCCFWKRVNLGGTISCITSIFLAFGMGFCY